MSLSIFLFFVGTSSSSFSTLFFTTGLEGGVILFHKSLWSVYRHLMHDEAIQGCQFQWTQAMWRMVRLYSDYIYFLGYYLQVFMSPLLALVVV